MAPSIYGTLNQEDDGVSWAQPDSIEPLSHYRPGGYHVVHIGDTLRDGRYKILNKLGWGATSTVWLATDAHEHGSTVAIAIFKSEKSTAGPQLLEKMNYLATGDPEHPGRRMIMFPRDSFHEDGPNGTHFCLVMKYEGQTISRATKRAQGSNTRPLALSRAKKAFKDLLLGVSYIHSVGMVHSGSLISAL
jgi:serine/threonine-protein kinase SRPK3